ncbi:MAG: site-2 protease family protein, partial [Nitrospira sp. WS110]|nr:site-2 protease family protein [Nitrospira sp. WS110]
MGLPLLFAMVLHEYAHGWVASKCGDSTAKLQGRLTVNPLAHIDPLGTVILPLMCLMLGSFLFGWAKPVPVDLRNLRQPRRDMALVAAAGPGMNLILAVSSALLLAVLLTIEPTLSLRGSAEAEASPGLLATMVFRPLAV